MSRVHLVVALAICLTWGTYGLADEKVVNSLRELASGNVVNSLRELGPVNLRGKVDRFGDPLPPGAIARVGTVRLRHPGSITGLAFARDGKTLFAAGRTVFTPGRGTDLRVWDVATGKLVRRFRDRQKSIKCLALSPDGQHLVSAGEDRTVVLWDVKTGDVVRRLSDRWCGFGAVAFSPDGQYVGAADHGGVHLWEKKTGKHVHTFVTENQQNWHLAFSPDGRTLASVVSRDSVDMMLCDLNTRKEVRRIPLSAQASRHVAYSPAGKILATASEGAIRLRDPGSGKEIRKLLGHRSGIQCFLFSPDGKTLASAGPDGLRLWDVARGKELHLLPHGWVGSLAFSPDSKLLASGGDSQVIRLWDVLSGKEQLAAPGHVSGLSGLDVSPDGRLVATAGDDGTIHLWETATGKVLHCLRGQDGPLSSVSFAPDGKTLATAAAVGVLCLWDVPGQKLLRRWKAHAHGAGRIVFSPDGRTVASGGCSPGACLWDFPSGARRVQIRPSNGSAYEVRFSPDGRHLLAAAQWTDSDGISSTIDFQHGLELYDSATGSLVRRFPRDVWSRQPTFSPDGRQLALVRQSSEIISLRELSTGSLRRKLSAGERTIGCVAFSPDGRTLASGDDHATPYVRLWDLITGKELARFQGHEGEVKSLVFTRDGKRLVSRASDLTALVWDLAAIAARPRPSVALSAEELDKLWTDLAGDASRADQALRRLSSGRGQDLERLRGRLSPVRVDGPRLARLIADLDSKRFPVRREARMELEKLGDLAELALRSVLKGKPSLEVRRLAEELLDKLARRELTAEQLRVLRVMESLEHSGTREARRLLKELAGGAPGALITREAKAALERGQP